MNTEAQRLVSPLIEHFRRSNMCRDYTGVEGEKCMLVTLPFPTANWQQSYYFAPNTILDGDNCTITGIDMIGYGALNTLPNGQSNFSGGEIRVWTGVLYVSNLNREIIAELPIYTLDRDNNNGKPCFVNFDTHVWQNCYVQFAEANFTTSTEPLAFMVWYVPKVKN
jgi:hypothetical protein